MAANAGLQSMRKRKHNKVSSTSSLNIFQTMVQGNRSHAEHGGPDKWNQRLGFRDAMTAGVCGTKQQREVSRREEIQTVS